MVTRGDTPLARHRREVLTQEIIWLYNPELAVKLQLQSRRSILDLQNQQLDIFDMKCMNREKMPGLVEKHVPCPDTKTPATESAGRKNT